MNNTRILGDKKIKKLIFKESVQIWPGVPSHWDMGEPSDLQIAELLIVSHILRLESSTNARYTSPLDEGARFLISCEQYFNAHNNGISVTGMGAKAQYVKLDTGCGPWKDDAELVKALEKTDPPEINDWKGLPVRTNKERIDRREQDEKIFKDLVDHPGFDVTIKYDEEGRKQAFMIDEKSIDCGTYTDNLKKEREKKNGDTNTR